MAAPTSLWRTASALRLQLNTVVVLAVRNEEMGLAATLQCF